MILKEENGNRKGVQDIVLIITDGASKDDVAIPSQKLRATGAQVNKKRLKFLMIQGKSVC